MSAMLAPATTGALPWVVYIRRSSKAEGDADVSDEQQEAAARARVPAGSPVLVITDSGGKNSGYSTARPGYQRLLDLVAAGAIAGVAAYDDSRLNRNAENALALLRQCVARGIAIATGTTNPDTLDTSHGRFVYGLMGGVSQLYRDQQSEKVRALCETLFENGRHRGGDPFGYRSARDGLGRIAQPRTLEVVEADAAVVRRVFTEIARRPMADVARTLNAEGVLKQGRPWSKEAVKDLWRRRRLYRGFVVKKRGVGERPGHHEAILTEEEYSAAVAAVGGRRRARSAPRRVQRLYLLRGVAFCGECGSRLRGDTRVSRGQEWRYYACPVADGKSAVVGPDGELVDCHARRVPADAAEVAVLERIAAGVLDDAAIAQARTELAVLLDSDVDSDAERVRARLGRALDALRKQHQWGDLTDDQYRDERTEIEAQMAALPGDDDRLGTFDRNAEVLPSLARNLEYATPAQRQELVALVVERVDTKDKAVVSIEWTPPAAPFFAEPEPASFWRPRRDSNPRRPP